MRSSAARSRPGMSEPVPQLPPRPPERGDMVPIVGGGPADGEKVEYAGCQILRTPSPEPPDPPVGWHVYRLQLVTETIQPGSAVVWAFRYIGRQDA